MKDTTAKMRAVVHRMLVRTQRLNKLLKNGKLPDFFLAAQLELLEKDSDELSLLTRELEKHDPS